MVSSEWDIEADGLPVFFQMVSIYEKPAFHNYTIWYLKGLTVNLLNPI